MTPKRFFDPEGGAFPYTVLDDRAGVRQPSGYYTSRPTADGSHGSRGRR